MYISVCGHEGRNKAQHKFGDEEIIAEVHCQIFQI